MRASRVLLVFLVSATCAQSAPVPTRDARSLRDAMRRVAPNVASCRLGTAAVPLAPAEARPNSYGYGHGYSQNYRNDRNRNGDVAAAGIIGLAVGALIGSAASRPSYGYASPSKNADTSLLGPVQQVATAAVAASKVQFVLGDLLPGDLVDEYRVQLQKFLQDPSDATIDAVTAAIEAKAQEFY